MAERLTSSGARDLDFISTNPAMDAYEHGQKIARENASQDLIDESRKLANDYSRSANPTRLRDLEATTSSNETKAGVDQQTAPYKVQDAYNTSRSTGANADVAVGTVAPRISQANSAATTAAAGADVAQQTVPYKVEEARSASRLGTVNADVSEATKPDKIAAPGIANRAATANAQNAELQSIYKEVELLNKGDIDGAQSVAAAAGHTLPPELVSNADARAAISTAIKHAQELYPNRPKDQLSFIQGFIQDMATRKGQGQPANAPAAPFQVPNAPTPPEDTSRDSFDIIYRQEQDPNDPSKTITKSYNHSKTTGELTPIEGQGAFSKPGAAGGPGGGRQFAFDKKREAWLAVYPNDQQGALAYASGRKQMGDTDLQRAAASILNAKNPKPPFMNAAQQAQRDQQYQQILADLRANNSAGGAPQQPGAPAASPSAPPQGLTGSGTKQQPFQATSQDHITWFKQSAPPGAVIMINGQPYTK